MSRTSKEQPSLIPFESHHYGIYGTRLEMVRTPIYSKEAPTFDAALPIREPAQAAEIAAALIGNQPQEHLIVLMLNTRNNIIGIHTVTIGNVNTAMINIGDVVRPLLLSNTVSAILVHNRPGDDPSPSPEDISVTRSIYTAMKMLDIDLLDHVIVCGYPAFRFVSIKERHANAFVSTYSPN